MKVDSTLRQVKNLNGVGIMSNGYRSTPDAQITSVAYLSSTLLEHWLLVPTCEVRPTQ